MKLPTIFLLCVLPLSALAQSDTKMVRSTLGGVSNHIPVFDTPNSPSGRYIKDSGYTLSALSGASNSWAWIQANSNAVWTMTNNWPWVTSTVSWTSNGYVNLSNSWFGSTAYHIDYLATQAWWQATVNSSAFTNWLATNTYVKVETDPVWTNWFATNTWFSYFWQGWTNSVAATNFMATNTFATTNWVDVNYYPRSNPSNYVDRTVTNGLLGAEVDTIQTVLNRRNTATNNITLWGTNAVRENLPGHPSCAWQPLMLYVSTNGDGYLSGPYCGHGNTKMYFGLRDPNFSPVFWYENRYDVYFQRSIYVTNGTVYAQGFDGPADGMSGCPSGAVATNRTLTINGQVWTLNSNGVFTVAGGGTGWTNTFGSSTLTNIGVNFQNGTNSTIRFSGGTTYVDLASSSGGGAWGGGVVTTNITVSNSLAEIKGQDASNRWWRLAESNGTVTLYRKALDIVTVPTSSNIVWTDSALGQQDHWNFESNATPQIDLWQGSNSMAHSGSPVWTITGTNQDGVVEHGYRFDGTTYMHNETLTGLSNTSGSASMWMKFDSLPSNDQAVAWSFWYTNGTYLAGNQTFVDLSGIWNDAGQTYWRADGRKVGTTQWTVHNAFTEATNVWYNVTLVQPGDGSDMQFYVNGIKRPLTYTDSTSKSFWTAQARGAALRADSLWLMRYKFKGVLDDPRIYTNALTSNQVYQIWQNTSPTNNLERTYQATASYNVTNTSEKAILVATASGTTNENGVQTFGEATGRTVIEGASTRLNVSGSEVLKLDSTGLNPGTDNLTPLGKTGAKYSDVQTYKLNGLPVSTLTTNQAFLESTLVTKTMYITNGIIYQIQ